MTFKNVFLVLLVTVLGCGQSPAEVPLDATPTVTATAPADGTLEVDTHTQVSASFSEAMDSTTLTAATFTLTQAGIPVLAAVSYAGTTATLVPSAELARSTLFTATMTTEAKDERGIGLAANYVWTFTTTAPDTTAPTVAFTDPADQAIAVPIGVKINAAFSETMDAATLDGSTFTLMNGATIVPGAVTYSGVTATFTPANALAANSMFTAAITTGTKDLAGNALATTYGWVFTTSDVADATPPTVTSTDPADGATRVDVGTTVNVAFDETVDCTTLSTSSFTLGQGTTPIAGMVTCDGLTATFTPTFPLPDSATFTAKVTTAVKDPSGNALTADYTFSFKTGVRDGAAPVALGAASTYAILAFNTVTNVNNVGTMVIGDLGISPGAALTGFPPGQVTGTIHAGDTSAATAKASLLAAYNDAVARLGAVVLPADLSGLTFTPGLYKNSTSVMIAAGNLTLDAQGDANAVFIFQMGSTLTTHAGTQVILSGGAKATNIFWAVGTSATLGTNSIFKGTLLVASAITMKTGAALEGRILAQGAAVALDTNTITVPAP